MTRIEIRNEYFVDSDDIFRSVNVTLTILLCRIIFFRQREKNCPLGALSRMEITTNVSVTKLEVFVCFFPVQFAFFGNLLKVCLLFLDLFLSRRIWYFYNNNREHLSPLCKRI